MSLQRGSVLLLSLWATATLAAVGILQATRLSMELKWLDRFQEVSQALYVAQTGVHVAGGRISKDDPAFDAPKEMWGQLPKEPIAFGPGTFQVAIRDEQALIPINAAPQDLLLRLPGFTPASATELISRREKGKLVVHLAELTSLPGFQKDRLGELVPLVTVYGTGPVNLNTAGKEVLVMLGFSQAFSNRVLQYQAGPDGLAGTKDDGVFPDAQQIQPIAEKSFGPFLPADQQLLSALLESQRVGVRSSFFRVEVEGRTNRHGIARNVVAILERVAATAPPAIRGWYEPR